MPETKDVLIKVRNLKTYYPVKQGCLNIRLDM